MFARLFGKEIADIQLPYKDALGSIVDIQDKGAVPTGFIVRQPSCPKIRGKSPTREQVLDALNFIVQYKDSRDPAVRNDVEVRYRVRDFGSYETYRFDFRERCHNHFYPNGITGHTGTFRFRLNK